MELDELFSEFKEAFYGDDFDKQLMLHESIQKFSSKKSTLEYDKFLEDIEYFDECIELLHSKDWSLVGETEEVRIESKPTPDNFCTRTSLFVNANIFSVLCVLSEIELIPSWVDVITNTSMIREVSNTRKLAFYEFWFPWPASHRECVLEFSSYPIRSEQAAIIMMKTPRHSSYLSTPVRATSPQRSLEVKIGALYVQFISPTCSKVIFAVRAHANIVMII